MTTNATTRAKATVAHRIATFNKGRDPERLRLKYEAMRNSPFTFLRGTCHLFYEDWAHDHVIDTAPLAWISGDLHLENFGSYRGENRLVYFDVNDFDEAVLAPCTRDVVRLLTSLIVGTQGTRGLGLKRSEALKLCKTFVERYTAGLQRGKALWIERETASGMVRSLLRGLEGRMRQQLLAKRVEHRGGKYRLRIDGRRTLKTSPEDRARVETFMKAFAKKQAHPGFFRLLDVARRIAGTGSLGLPRDVLLIWGKGAPGGLYLLDLKAARPSALKPYLKVPQPRWASEAERVVTLQRRIQAVSPAFLQPIKIGRESYVLRELQPVEDRLDLESVRGHEGLLEPVVGTMGDLVAWAHLRGSGRQGAATADDLIAFAKSTSWHRRVTEYAETYSRKVNQDWEEFRTALKAGFFKQQTALPAAS